MPVGAIEREIGDAYARLAEATAMARHCHEHYLDDLGGSLGAATGELAGDGRGLAGDGRGLAGDGRGLAGDGRGLAGDGRGLAGDGRGLAGDGRGLAGNGRGLAGDGRGLAGGGRGLAGGGLAGRDLTGTVTALTAAHPWALGGFGEPAWDGYRPDPHAPPPDGLRVGLLRTPGGPAQPCCRAFAAVAARCRRWPGSPGTGTC